MVDLFVNELNIDKELYINVELKIPSTSLHFCRKVIRNDKRIFALVPTISCPEIYYKKAIKEATKYQLLDLKSLKLKVDDIKADNKQLVILSNDGEVNQTLYNNDVLEEKSMYAERFFKLKLFVEVQLH